MALIYAIPGETRDVVLSPGPGTGLAASLGVTLMKVVTGGADTVAVARDAGVSEDPAGSNIYTASIAFPTAPGDYYPLWDDGSHSARDDDTYRVSYSAAAPGTLDAPYFTTAEFRAAYPNDDAVAALSDDEINAERVTAEQIIEGLDAEEGAHVAFVPRTETFHMSGSGGTRIAIPRYRVRTVESLIVDNVTELDADDVVLEASSVFVPHWPSGFSNIEITVTHGYDSPPGRIKKAAMMLTYNRLVGGPLDDRTLTQTVDGGTITYAQPGVRGSITGILEVDAAIKQFAKKKPRVRSIVTTDRGNQFPANDWLWRYRR